MLCSKRWQIRRLALWSVCGVAAIVIVVLTALLSLNPYSNKYVYMFQAYVYPGCTSGRIPIPPGYTGVARHWDKEGQLLEECEVRNGIPDGRSRKYRCMPHTLFEEGTVRTGKPEGLWTTYYGPGWRQSTRSYREGEIHGVEVLYLPNGAVGWVKFWVEGKQVVPSEYRKALQSRTDLPPIPSEVEQFLASAPPKPPDEPKQP